VGSGAVEAGARVSARETAASGVHWTFAPMVDIARDPRWRRRRGGDPYLGSADGRARSRLAGTDLRAPEAVMARRSTTPPTRRECRDYNRWISRSGRCVRSICPVHAASTRVPAASCRRSTRSAGCRAREPLVADALLRREWGFRGLRGERLTPLKNVQHGIAGSRGEAGMAALDGGVYGYAEPHLHR